MILSETGERPVATPSAGRFAAHLRLAEGFGDEAAEADAASAYLESAVAAIERCIGCPLVARRFSLSLSRLDRDGGLRLPLGPVAAIETAAVEGPSGTRALDPGIWAVEAETHRPRVSRAGGPLAALAPGERLRLVFEAGLAPDWDRVPADLAEAVLLLAAEFHERRDAEAVWPAAVAALVAPWTPVRL
ncbi:MAG: hypothetical protein ACFBWO_00155 [Paracoccaceae bacterium]